MRYSNLHVHVARASVPVHGMILLAPAATDKTVRSQAEIDAETWKHAHLFAADALRYRRAKKLVTTYRGVSLRLPNDVTRRTDQSEEPSKPAMATRSSSLSNCEFVGFSTSSGAGRSRRTSSGRRGRWMAKLKRTALYLFYNLVFSRPGLMVGLGLYVLFGGTVFLIIEGVHERYVKQTLLDARRNMYHVTWHHVTRTANDSAAYWKLMVNELMIYERNVRRAFKSGVTTDATDIVFDLWGSMLYCLTIITTIGEFCTICFAFSAFQGQNTSESPL